MWGISVEKLCIAAAIVVIGVTLYFASTPERTVGTNVVLPTTSNFVLVGKPDAAHRTLTIQTTKPIPANSRLDIDLDANGVMSTSPLQASALTAAGVHATVSVNREFFHANTKWFPPEDFGTFVAYRPGGTFTSNPAASNSSLVAGLRFSPCRLLYGTVAPDVLIAPHAIGAGCSLYAPPDTWGSSWAHWGIGVGRLWGTDGSRPATVGYLSFSTFNF